MIVRLDFRKMAVLCNWAWKSYEFLEAVTTEFLSVKTEKTFSVRGIVFDI